MQAGFGLVWLELKSNYALDEFLENFPTVSHEAAVAVVLLERSEEALLAVQ